MKKIIVGVVSVIVLFNVVFFISVVGALASNTQTINTSSQDNNKNPGETPNYGDGQKVEGWLLPVKHSSPYISCLYGDDWIEGRYRFHKGIDITGGGFNDTPILSARDGVVTVAEYSGSYGYYVMVNHGTIDGKQYTTLYAHCNSLPVSVGQQVKQGDVVGYGGNTGFSFGAHLHYEVRVNGAHVDPRPYIPDILLNLV